MRIKQLAELLPGPFNNDNLHRIAISNLSDQERQLMRWWSRKYRQPLKPFLEHTVEELVIEMLEDFYEKNPAEAERLKNKMSASIDEQWDGKMDAEYERSIQARLKKIKPIDTNRFKSDVVLSPEEEKAIIENLGKNLPGSKRLINQTMKDEKVIGEDSFDDDFGVS